MRDCASLVLHSLLWELDVTIGFCQTNSRPQHWKFEGNSIDVTHLSAKEHSFEGFLDPDTISELFDDGYGLFAFGNQLPGSHVCISLD